MGVLDTEEEEEEESEQGGEGGVADADMEVAEWPCGQVGMAWDDRQPLG